MSAPVAPVLGANEHFVLNSGTLETPTWTDMPNVGDLDPGLEFADQEVTKRMPGGFRQHEPTLADISLSTEHLYDPADEQLKAIDTAALTRAAIDVAIMDGPIDEPGVQGWRMRLKCFKRNSPATLDGIKSLNYDWKLPYSKLPPQYLLVGSANIVNP